MCKNEGRKKDSSLSDAILAGFVFFHTWIAVTATRAEKAQTAALHVIEEALGLLDICIYLRAKSHCQGVLHEDSFP